MDKFSGLIAAPFAPLDNHGELATDRIAPYHHFLARNGIVGAFINGSSGEGVSLSLAEKQRVVEAWCAAARNDGRIKVIALIAGTSYVECAEQALHAQQSGVDAIALIAPYYFKAPTARQLAEYCARIAAAVPQIPVFYYHIPVLTGCHIPMLPFLQEAAPIIPNLAGIKYTHEDFMDFLSCIHFMDGRYDLLWGRDENLLSALVLGTRAGVGSTYNYAAPLYYRMIEAFDRGDLPLARRLQQQSIDMIMLLGKYGGIATGKAYMRYVGMECGEFRLPVKNMSRAEYDRFGADVRALNMAELFSAA